jgi:hypothetical protein
LGKRRSGCALARPRVSIQVARKRRGLIEAQASTPVASTSPSTSFAWDDFGIGMAAAFGLVLLAGGLAVAVRTGTRKRVSIPS